MNEHPAGYIKNNKTDIDMKWKSKGYALDPEQNAQMQAEAAAKLQARDAEQAKLQEQTAQRVGRQLADLVPVEQPTPYMQAKDSGPAGPRRSDNRQRLQTIGVTYLSLAASQSGAAFFRPTNPLRPYLANPILAVPAFLIPAAVFKPACELVGSPFLWLPRPSIELQKF